MTAEKKTYRGRTFPDFILPDKDKKSTRRFLKGGETTSFDIKLKTVTPILGGGYHTRELDDVDIIRVPTIRGHLRFWWRALYAHKFKGSEELYEAECKLWGGAGGEDDGAGKSKVELRIKNKKELYARKDSYIDSSKVHTYTSKKKDFKETVGSYALWVAQEPHADRYKEGLVFELYVRTPIEHLKQVRNTIKAWILFGGYGSRTRRGLGSLTVNIDTKNKDKEKETEDINRWLPKEADGKAINNLFEGLDPLGKEVGEEDKFKGDTPRLPGALLYVKDTMTEDQDAWKEALNKLKAFRQGRGFAREQGDQRPGRSRWPEADKIRRLTSRIRAHTPRFNSECYWPRAGFGLPIGGQFVTSRGREEDEPGNFLIKWRDDEDSHDRLASPLILKPLPLANGKYVPCALWLNRGYPKGEVFVDGLNGSEAPFDKLTADNDKVLFKPLQGKGSLRDAFLDWLGTQGFKEVQ